MKRDKKVSNAVILRMPRYYRHVNELLQRGVDRISSGSLSKRLGLTASQIRQDFSCFGEFGQQGYGYNLETLRTAIADILGANKKQLALLVGVGNLGRALLNNFDFESCGFQITAAFDIRPEYIGEVIDGTPIISSLELKEFIAENKIDLAVLTVKKEAALQVASNLVEYGIRGIWNFTNLDLHIENPDVHVENVHFADSLLTLSYHLNN